MTTYRQDVEQSHRETYANTIQMVHDENATKIRSAVTVIGGLTGAAHNVRDLLDKREYQEFEDYDDETPDNRSNLTPVWLHRPKAIGDGQVIRKADKFDLAMDPTSQFNVAMVKGVEKGVFDRTMGIRKKSDGTYEVHGGGILGSRVTGKNGNTSAGLPAAQTVTHGSTGMNSDKLIEGVEKLHLADWGMDDDITGELWAAIGAKQITDLLNIAKAAGASLNEFEILQLRTGKPTELLGVTWMFTNRLPLDSNGHRMCPIWTKSNIALGFWQDVQGDIRNRPDLRGNPPYVEIDAYPEATRLEDEGVVVIPCLEA